MQNPNSAVIMLEDYDAGKPEHKRQFAALNREWLQKFFFVEEYDEAMFVDPQASVLAKGGYIVFARAEGEVVGTCSLLPMEEGVYEIAKMGVTERWQKHKIGEKLLIACFERAKTLKAKKLFIVSNTALEPAIRLYRRYGFVDSAEIRHGHYARGNITLERNMA